MSALRTDVIIADQLPVILQALRVTTGVTVRVRGPVVGVGVRLGGETGPTALLTAGQVGEVGPSLQAHSVSVREGGPDTMTTHGTWAYRLNIFIYVKYLINCLIVIGSTQQYDSLHSKVVLTEHFPHRLRDVELLLPGEAAGLPVHPLRHVQQFLVSQDLSAKL